MEQALTRVDAKILFDDFSHHTNICNTLRSLKLGDS